MRLNFRDKEAVVSGIDSDATEFKFSANAKSFKALSDTLYKDKVGSIVRELSCNAFDAHKEAGNEKTPFIIELPTEFSPMFTIRDFGTGISHNDMMNVYSTYFESTKDDSNDGIGAYGLGSKTPLCYTDSFSVTSIYGGEKRNYCCYLNKGIPTIVQVDKAVETDEPDGLRVSLSVKEYDFNSFKNAVVFQLKHFPVKPEVKNEKVQWIEFEQMIGSSNSNGSYLKSFKTNSRDNGLEIVQGPVGYTVDYATLLEQLEKVDHKEKNDVREFASNLYNSSNLHCLYVPIGTVDVVLSRENISWDERTIKNVFILLNKFKDDFVNEFKNKLSNTKTDVEFIKLWESSLGFLQKLDDDFLQKAGFNRQYNTLVKNIADDSDLNGLTVSMYEKNQSFGKRKIVHSNTNSVQNKAGWLGYRFNYAVANGGVIFIKDVKTNFLAKIEHYLEENNITLDHKSKIILMELNGDNKDTQFKKFKKLFTGLKYVNISSIKIPNDSAANRGSSKGVPRTNYYTLRNHSETNLKNYHLSVTDTDVDEIEESCVYLNSKGGTVSIKEYNIFDFDLVNHFGYTPIAIAGNKKKKAEENENLIHIEEFIKKHAKEIKKYVTDLIKKRNIYDLVYSSYLRFSPYGRTNYFHFRASNVVRLANKYETDDFSKIVSIYNKWKAMMDENAVTASKHLFDTYITMVRKKLIKDDFIIKNDINHVNEYQLAIEIDDIAKEFDDDFMIVVKELTDLIKNKPLYFHGMEMSTPDNNSSYSSDIVVERHFQHQSKTNKKAIKLLEDLVKVIRNFDEIVDKEIARLYADS